LPITYNKEENMCDNVLIKISVNMSGDCPTINSNIDFDKIDEIDNKEILYTLVGILDNAKQKLNYFIEMVEAESEEVDCENEELIELEFGDELKNEINNLLNGFDDPQV